MTNSIFKQTIFISILGHITLFTMFSFSFGPKIPPLNFTQIYFRGAILRGADLMGVQKFNGRHKTGVMARKSEALVLDKISREPFQGFNDYSKPPLTPAFDKEKIVFVEKAMPGLLVSGRKEPAIMFYPPLPYHFVLYFKDRQVAHIELMFEVISTGRKNSIFIKRKVSSGNLEADLLSMRYIGHYLFIQQAAFAPNNWQTVKIDLSALDD